MRTIIALLLIAAFTGLTNPAAVIASGQPDNTGKATVGSWSAFREIERKIRDLTSS